MLLVMTGAPGTPWLWSLPFLLTFIGGVFADTYEGPRGTPGARRRRRNRLSLRQCYVFSACPGMT